MVFKRRTIRLATFLVITVAHGPVMASSTTTYTYDVLGRLVQASTTGSVNNGAQMSTTYDAADNRTTSKVSGSASKVVVVPINGLTVLPVLDN